MGGGKDKVSLMCRCCQVCLDLIIVFNLISQFLIQISNILFYSLEKEILCLFTLFEHFSLLFPDFKLMLSVQRGDFLFHLNPQQIIMSDVAARIDNMWQFMAVMDSASDTNRRNRSTISNNTIKSKELPHH